MAIGNKFDDTCIYTDSANLQISS